MPEIITNTFDFNSFAALAQLLGLFGIVLLPVGVVVSCRAFRGSQALFWSAMSLIPLLGPLAALVAAHHHRDHAFRAKLKH